MLILIIAPPFTLVRLWLFLQNFSLWAMILKPQILGVIALQFLLTYCATYCTLIWFEAVMEKMLIANL